MTDGLRLPDIHPQRCIVEQKKGAPTGRAVKEDCLKKNKKKVYKTRTTRALFAVGSAVRSITWWISLGPVADAVPALPARSTTANLKRLAQLPRASSEYNSGAFAVCCWPQRNPQLHYTRRKADSPARVGTRSKTCEDSAARNPRSINTEHITAATR